MRALFAVFGAGIGAAIALLTYRPHPPTGEPGDGRARWRRRIERVGSMRAAAVLAAAAVVGAATRWPVAAVLAGLAAHTLPPVLGPDRAHQRTLARIEALAAWAEDLAGTLRSGAGLEQAILHTAAVAPAAIRTELTTLATAPQAGIRLPAALRAFSRTLADPTADLIVHVLLQAAEHEARDVAGSLAGVGAAARRHACARLDIATSRARTRTSTRIIVTVVAATVAGLAVFAGDLLAPYGSPFGQLVLAILGTLFTLCLLWMVRMGRIPDMPRILAGHDTTAVGMQASR